MIAFDPVSELQLAQVMQNYQRGDRKEWINEETWASMEERSKNQS